MARRFPKGAVNQLRGFHLLIASLCQLAAHIGFDLTIQGPATRMPEYRACGLFLHMEQIQRPPQLAVITLFSFFQHRQIGFEILFIQPCCAIDTLKHRPV